MAEVRITRRGHPSGELILAPGPTGRTITVSVRPGGETHASHPMDLILTPRDLLKHGGPRRELATAVLIERRGRTVGVWLRGHPIGAVDAHELIAAVIDLLRQRPPGHP